MKAFDEAPKIISSRSSPPAATPYRSSGQRVAPGFHDSRRLRRGHATQYPASNTRAPRQGSSIGCEMRHVRLVSPRKYSAALENVGARNNTHAAHTRWKVTTRRTQVPNRE